MRSFFLFLTLGLCYSTFVYAKWLGCKESLGYTTFARIATAFDLVTFCSVDATGNTFVTVTDGKTTYKHDLKKNREVK